MTYVGSMNYFLGISVTHTTKGMLLFQKKYATEIFVCAGMRNCCSCKTPVDKESKLGAGGTSVSDPTLYRSLAGALNISFLLELICLMRFIKFVSLCMILRSPAYCSL